MKYRVIVFDMDGVLVEEDSSWITVHNYFKVNNGVSFKKYLNGEIDYCEFMKRDIALWPKVNIREIEHIFNTTHPAEGAKYVIDELKKKGFITALVSAGIDILANRINDELGLDYVFANKLETDKMGNLTGTGQCKVELLRKDLIVSELSKQLNIPLAKFVAIGDSKYDIPMLKIVGLSIAFHPKDNDIRDIADVVIENSAITKLLDFL